MSKRFSACLTGLMTLFAVCRGYAADAAVPTAVAATARADAAAPTAAQEQAALREEFTAAMQRVGLHAPEPPDSAALEHFVIYDYLVAARMRRDLELKPGDDLDKAIDAFLTAHGTQPVSRNLRSDWLASLAARRRWDWFLPRATNTNSPVLLCDRLAGKLATGDTQKLAADALARWILPQRQPAECDPVFSWLRLQGVLTPALAENRTRAALAAENPRLAREFAADVPADRALPLLQLALLLETPKAALSTLATHPTAQVEPAALEAGFNRLARNDSNAASALLPLLLARPDVTPEMQAHLQHSAALGAAYSRDPSALTAFANLPISAVDGDVQEWRARAALWAGNYAKALTWIEQMPPNLAELPRWRYWHARATAATSGNEAAAPLYAEIAGLRDFYGYLAADRLNRNYTLNARPLPDDEAVQNSLAAEPGLVRAHALLDCDMADEAAVEWAVVVGSAENSVKVQAARLAARWGWYEQSISTVAQTGELDDVRLRYPRPYTTAVTEAGKLTQLPSDWILAVMRQESLFRDDAVSRAGARGLMQMMPSTAAAVARRWNLPVRAKEPSVDPTSDILRGAAYLRELLDRYNGQLDLGLAAYNAGPIPVARWLPTKTVDADIWIENIPYGETRTYVQRILEHIVAFAWVRDAEPPRLTALLPPVAPAAASAQTIPTTHAARTTISLASKR